MVVTATKDTQTTNIQNTKSENKLDELDVTAKKTNETAKNFWQWLGDCLRNLFCCSFTQKEVENLTHSKPLNSVAEKVGFTPSSPKEVTTEPPKPKPFKPNYSGKEVGDHFNIQTTIGKNILRLRQIKARCLENPEQFVKDYYIGENMPQAIRDLESELDTQIKEDVQALSYYYFYKGDTPTAEEAQIAIRTGRQPNNMSDEAWKKLEQKPEFQKARQRYIDLRTQLETLYLGCANKLINGELATITELKELISPDAQLKLPLSQQVETIIFNGTELEQNNHQQMDLLIRSWSSQEIIGLNETDPTLQGQAFLAEIATSTAPILQPIEQKELKKNKQELVFETKNKLTLTFDSQAGTITSMRRVQRKAGEEVKATYEWVETFHRDNAKITREVKELTLLEKK